MKMVHLILSVFVGYGCAAKKMVAVNADILLEKQITKRLPLNADQKSELSKDIDKFLLEQKSFAKEAIPIITSIELNVNEVDIKYASLESLYKRLAINFSNLISKYMAMLDNKQQQKFKNKIRSENRELRNQSKSEGKEKN